MKFSNAHIAGIVSLTFGVGIQPALAAPVGKVAVAIGEVKINGKPARVGAPLEARDRVETADGRAILIIGSRNVVHLNPETKLLVESYSKSKDGKTETASLAVASGTIRSLMAKERGVEKAFKIRSRSTTMGVRGCDVITDNPIDLSKPDSHTVIEGSGQVYKSAYFTETAFGGITDQAFNGNEANAAMGGTFTADSLGAEGEKIEVSDGQSFTADTGDTKNESPTKSQVTTLSKEDLQQKTASVGIEQTPLTTKDDTNSSSKTGDTTKTGATQIITSTPQPTFDPVVDGGASGNKKLTVEIRR